MANFTSNACWKINYDFPKIFLTVVYVITFIFGLLGNCLGLKSIFTNWRKMGNIKILALNLCITDIMYVLTLPFLLTYQVRKQGWIFGDPFCKVTRFIFNVNLYGSIGFLTCISVYRYLGIVHTMRVKGRINVRHSIGISALVWIVVLIQCLPDVFYEKTFENRLKCYDSTTDDYLDSYLKYSIIQTAVGLVIPFVIIVCSYGHVAVILVTKKDIGDSALKVKCLRLVVILALLFSICFIPVVIFRNLNLMTRISKKRGICKPWYSSIYIAKQISDGLACLNSAINPLVYLLNSNKLLKRYFSFKGKEQQDPRSIELSQLRSTED
ncbi:P2Y purinoceptor 1 [Clarias gariepinus]|uniref:P2Y purinoceptor 1 n=1 Tax=Clarias gariepinus TaxID=13013 RepID=UPI00234D87FB|nr:P2Y purinoceptor 1 [Clarias gariepinus]